MKKLSLLVPLAALFMASACSCNAQGAIKKGLESITVHKSKVYVNTLAGNKFNGRKAGSPEAYAAADRIAEWLDGMGIQPFGETYFIEVDTSAFPPPRNPFPKVRNVLGKIEGKNPDEYVFIGAHYDHIGTNPKLKGDKIFNGADDNASGVAGVLQVAGAFAASGEKPERTVVFAFWDAEELGLLGSNRFNHTFDNIEGIKAYFNLDMIGRDEGGTNKAAYFSTDTLPYIRYAAEDTEGFGLDINMVAEIDSVAASFPGFLQIFKDGSSGKIIFAALPNNSDHAAFRKNKIPVYMITTGLHPDYHKVTDEADKIAFGKMTEITKFAYITMYRLANPGDKMSYPIK